MERILSSTVTAKIDWVQTESVSARWFHKSPMLLFHVPREAVDALYGACSSKGQEAEYLSW